MAFNFKGIRRFEANNKVQVLTDGGWMNANLLSPANLLKVISDSHVQKYTIPSEADGFIAKNFHEVWGEEWDDDYEVPKGEGGSDGHGKDSGDESDGSKQNGEKGDPQGNGDTPGNGDQDAKFEMPASGPGTGEASSDDNLKAVRQVEDGSIEAVPFDVAFIPRAENIGQAIMSQTVEFVRNDIAEAVDAIQKDVADAFTATDTDLKAYVDDALKRFQPKDSGQKKATQVIVKVEIVKAGVPKEIEGLAHSQMPRLMKYVSSGQHTYLPGPPGTGKSHSAFQVAQALDWKFGSISLGPTTPDSRLWGGMDAGGHFHTTALIDCVRHAQDNPESGAIFTFDEMDNGHPGIIATVNSLLANGWVTLPSGETLNVGPNFVALACANTFGTGPTAEFAGRNRLDAATLDRFAYLPWDTDLGVERTLVEAYLAEMENGKAVADDWLTVWYETRKLVEKNGIKAFVTMRGAINGAKLLSLGESVEHTWGAVLGNKLPEDQKRKVNPL